MATGHGTCLLPIPFLFCAQMGHNHFSHAHKKGKNEGVQTAYGGIAYNAKLGNWDAIEGFPQTHYQIALPNLHKRQKDKAILKKLKIYLLSNAENLIIFEDLLCLCNFAKNIPSQ
jgi:hypothetical protein